jgi:hypothetical protein
MSTTQTDLVGTVPYSVLLVVLAVVVAGTLGYIDGNLRLGVITGLGAGVAFAVLNLLRLLSG